MRRRLSFIVDLLILALTYAFFHKFSPFAGVLVFDDRHALAVGEAIVLSLDNSNQQAALSLKENGLEKCHSPALLSREGFEKIVVGSKVPVYLWKDNCLAISDKRWARSFSVIGWILLTCSAVAVGHIYGILRTALNRDIQRTPQQK